MEEEMKNLAEVSLAVITSLCYIYFISSRIPKGKLRLVSLFPIVSLFTVLPLHLTYAIPTFFATFFIASLANFKLLLYAFGLGPLSSYDIKPLPIFITLACLPVRNSNNSSFERAKPKKLRLNLPTEVFLLSILIGVTSNYSKTMHPKVVLVCYCCIVHLLVDVIMSTSNTVARALVGLELEPPSDEPYLASSLQDFWGKRWNLIVTNTLRHVVYKPVRSRWGPLPGVMSSFLVSGLMHELVFYYITRVSPTWEMTGFFVLQGACVVVEVAVKRAVGNRWRLPLVVAAPLTLGFVVVTSSWLFFPPLADNGTISRITEEINFFVNFIRNKVSYWIKSTIVFSSH